MNTVGHNSKIIKLREALQEKYGRLVVNPKEPFHYVKGRTLAKRLDYPDATLDLLPESIVHPFTGVGNPFSILPFDRGMNIVDIGCGAGMDACIAAKLVGSRGNVMGLDMTEEMIQVAHQASEDLRLPNVGFLQGYAEDIPLPANNVDIVISNGVLSLCPDKLRVFKEIYRILRPGGRVQLADILTDEIGYPFDRARYSLWTDSMAGSISLENCNELLKEAGFVNIAIGKEIDIFAGSRMENRAARCRARGNHIFACK